MRSAGFPIETRAADLVQRADAGEANAVAVLQQWAEPLRCALESIAAVMDPELIVLGGGLGRAALAALHYAPSQSEWFCCPIRAAILDDDAGTIGAGLYALENQSASARQIV